MNFKITSISIISAALALALASCVNSPTNNQVATDGEPVQVKYPIAKPVLNAEGQPVKNVYISPYKPYNPIETKGYSSGDIVGDPSTAKINPKTGKIIEASAKIFRLP